MVFAIISGIAVFGQFPDWIASLGMVLIVATGLYAAHREAKLSRANQAAAELTDTARTQAR
jgi:drug/metabolite transporter (DMT)-like permease